MSKKILFISRRSPYGLSYARDALDALLAASVYDQDIGILFMDDGVFQLLKQQDSSSIAQKNLAAILPALELYEIKKIYVQRESLEARRLGASDLVLDDLHIIDNEEVRQLLAQQDQLLSF